MKCYLRTSRHCVLLPMPACICEMRSKYPCLNPGRILFYIYSIYLLVLFHSSYYIHNNWWVLDLIVLGRLKWVMGNQLAMELEEIINIYHESMLLWSYPSIMPMLYAWFLLHINLVSFMLDSNKFYWKQGGIFSLKNM